MGRVSVLALVLSLLPIGDALLFLPPSARVQLSGRAPGVGEEAPRGRAVAVARVGRSSRSQLDMFSGDHSVIADAVSILLAAEPGEVPGLGVPAMPQVSNFTPPEDIDNFPQMAAASLAGVLVYLYAAVEFGGRIVTQKRCKVCEGSGLVMESKTGIKLTQPRKCYACGGFLPWINWKFFFLSNLDIGNGGVLRRPAADYDALNEAARLKKEDAARRAGVGTEGGGSSDGSMKNV